MSHLNFLLRKRSEVIVTRAFLRPDVADTRVGVPWTLGPVRPQGTEYTSPR